jgi:predicted GNAT family acetyltransferase
MFASLPDGTSAIISAMTIVLTRDPSELAARAGGFLASRIECNLLATVLMNVVNRASADRTALFAYGLDGHRDVVSVALRVPPWPLLTSELDSSEAAQLVERWLREDPELSGVNSLKATAQAVARAWAQLTGGTTSCRMRQAMHVLSEVTDPPRPAPGRLQLAGRSDRPLLLGWMEEFAREAGVPPGGEAMLDAQLDRGGLLVWDHDGPVSMIGVSPSVAGVTRIGPVYTPPAHRRRGYGGSVVAATSRRALAHGEHSCMLFTDLSNPTSNKIYAEVGYRRAADWEEHALQPV